MFIPGRIEFLGKHTDYCGGRSIVCSIDRGFRATVEPRNDSLVVLENLDSAETVSFDLSEESDLPTGHWVNYASEVGRRVSRNFTEPLIGASISFRSDLPKAAGLSSSSALMIMVFAALAEADHLREREEFRANIASDLELAEYLGCIENGQSFRGFAGSAGVGTFGGSQDHAAILLGKPDRLSLFSFSPLSREADLAFPNEYVFVVASSGVAAEKTGAARERYNRVSRMVSEITSAMGGDLTLARAFTEIGIEEVQKVICDGRFSFSADDMLDRVEHFRVENFEIIPEVSELLADGQIDEIGDLIDRSQKNAESLLGNQIDETVFLQRSAREIGAIAASAFGAGFGGSVYALVSAADATDLKREWERKYHQAFPQHRDASEFLETRPSRIVL